MDQKLHDLIETEAKTLGFDLVRVAMIGAKSDPTLQVMAERPDTRQLNLTDCEALSRQLSERLDELEAAGQGVARASDYHRDAATRFVNKEAQRFQWPADGK